MRRLVPCLGLAAVALSVAPLTAQIAMPETRTISGMPLRADDAPGGSVSARVVRGGFDKSLPNQSVEFVIDGRSRVVRTDASGRAEVSGLTAGAKVRAVAVVDGERLESQEMTVLADAGMRVVLVATDPEAVRRAEEDRTLAAGPAAKGTVVFGPESRIIAEFNNDRLVIFYLLDIVNTARTPVDIGGPILVDLPREARGAAVLEGSSKQATVNGPRLIVTGPFAPGTTSVEVAFEQPSGGGTAVLDQPFPVPLQALNLIVQQFGAIDIASPQIATKQRVPSQDGAAIHAVGPAIPAGEALHLVITGLPHHPRWPRFVALTLAAGIMVVGIWAAATAGPHRRRA